MVLKWVFVLLGVLQFGQSAFVSPPPVWEYAKMARYIMHESAWVSVGTISARDPYKGWPSATLKSVSDGPAENGTGIPYIYMTDMDITGQDLNADNRVSILATLAATDYCTAENFDAQDPRCAKLILMGKFIKIDNTTDEYQFGQDALFSRHPSMATWPSEHNFYVSKVEIEQISVLDFFGGVKNVTVEEYFAANDDDEEDENQIQDIIFDRVEVIAVIA